MASLAAVPRCFGNPATHDMQPGDPRYVSMALDDVVVGSAGPYDIELDLGGGGTDRACSGGGVDYVTVDGPDSKADGGAGIDTVGATDGGLARGAAAPMSWRAP
jgi:hypothetical protein